MSVFVGFWPFLQNSSKELPIFCMIIDDNRVYCLTWIAFTKKASPGLKGNKCTICKVLGFFSKTAPKDLPNFLHGC